MRAVYVEQFNPEDPMASLQVGERPDATPPEGWTTVQVKAASLNQHDVWSLRGVGLKREHVPMVLGCDAAGIDEDGNEVLVHAVVRDAKGLSLFSERHQGTMSDLLVTPRENLLPKPAELSFEEAACLPTAWLTAYTMLFEKAQVAPGDTVLVQGAGGGLSNALVLLAKAAGVRTWVTSRTEGKRQFALDVLGADAAFESGARLPERVDAVMDSVGEATWGHSLKCLRSEGAMVVSGGTSGYQATANVAQVFAMQLRILGSSMGTLDGLRKLTAFCASTGVRPLIDRTLPVEQAADGFGAMVAEELKGKVVLTF